MNTDRPLSERSSVLATVLLWTQGLYFLVTGIWPLMSVETFQLVTGRKTDHLGTEKGDHWLVITVGVLIISIAIPLLAAAWRRLLNVETVILAIGSSIGLTAIDVIYVSRGAIPPIYLADAAAEVLLLAAWTVALIGSRYRHKPSSEIG